jgi:hypothetical protein
MAIDIISLATLGSFTGEHYPKNRRKRQQGTIKEIHPKIPVQKIRGHSRIGAVTAKWSLVARDSSLDKNETRGPSHEALGGVSFRRDE